MYDTKSFESRQLDISIDRDGIKFKIESGLIGERLRDVLEDEDVLDYFNRNLVQKVKTLACELLTQNGREYFNHVTRRDYLFENFKINLETNLIASSISYWMKLPYGTLLEDVMLRFLDVEFAKRVMDTLLRVFEEFRDTIKEKELNDFING